MRIWLEKYFGFTQKEIRGLCVLIFLIGILLAFPAAHSRIKTPNEEKISVIDKKEIQEFLSSIQSSGSRDFDFPISEAVTLEYFEFNPNELSISEGTRLGLTERQVRMIQNYVAKGGSFSKKEDFKKIYAIGDEDYERLFPYISIPRVESNYSTPSEGFTQNSLKIERIETKERLAKLSIELNTTDSIALQSLRGIGPVFASRIIRFRDNLGGFHDVSQLLSVYGMDEERFLGIRDYVTVDTMLVKKININKAEYDQLRKHSLISSAQANAIVQYRAQHGNYVTINR